MQGSENDSLIELNKIKILQNIVIESGVESSQECGYGAGNEGDEEDRNLIENKENISQDESEEIWRKEEGEENKRPEKTKDMERVDETMENEIRLLKKRSVSEALRDITTWPEKAESNENKKIRRKMNLPSVVTSDKWIELMEAKENEKQIKEKRKVKVSKKMETKTATRGKANDQGT